MKATIEISLYPLTEDYKSVVLDFLKILNVYKDIKVETNGLSTQIFGDYRYMMQMLSDEIFEVFQKQKAIIVMKIAAGELHYEK